MIYNFARLSDMFWFEDSIESRGQSLPYEIASFAMMLHTEESSHPEVRDWLGRLYAVIRFKKLGHTYEADSLKVAEAQMVNVHSNGDLEITYRLYDDDYGSLYRSYNSKAYDLISLPAFPYIKVLVQSVSGLSEACPELPGSVSLPLYRCIPISTKLINYLGVAKKRINPLPEGLLESMPDLRPRCLEDVERLRNALLTVCGLKL